MRHHAESWKGLVAGAAGGLAASFVMNQFQSAWSKATKKISEARKNGREQPREQPVEKQQEPEPDATMKAAEKLAKTLLKRPLNIEQQKKAGPWIHYAFGAITGAVYGLASEYFPEVRRGAGIPFGAAVFAGADELAMPALGLSKPAREYPLSTHAYALASHLVYGATTDLVFRGVRRLVR